MLMDIEILLEMEGADDKGRETIRRRFREWYEEGAEVRYDKPCFNNLTVIEEPNRFRVDLGQADALTAIRDLHARLHRWGAKVYVHFLY
jgi:hypothetical protein